LPERSEGFKRKTEDLERIKILKALKSIWESFGWVVGAYAVYNQLKTMKDMKNEIYENLSVEQKAQWDSITNKAQQVLPMTSIVLNQSIFVSVEQLKSGT